MRMEDGEKQKMEGIGAARRTILTIPRTCELEGPAGSRSRLIENHRGTVTAEGEKKRRKKRKGARVTGRCIK